MDSKNSFTVVHCRIASFYSANKKNRGTPPLMRFPPTDSGNEILCAGDPRGRCPQGIGVRPDVCQTA